MVELIQAVSPGATTDPASPQGMALQWISFDDPAQVNPCTYATVQQRFALATLYFATDGENWSGSEYWLSGEPECSWLGIACDDDDQVESIALCKLFVVIYVVSTADILT